MITVYPVLRQRMREFGVTSRELATAAEMRMGTFYLKMWGIMRWSLVDAVRICGFFNCPDPEHLFVRKHSKSQILESQGENDNV